MADELVLYHYWRSSCSWRVRWGLAHKGVSYVSVPVNILAGEHAGAEHKARNPAGLLPALKVKGRFFGESLAILEWLEEAYPEPPLLPKDPLDRLYVRQLSLTIAAGTQPLQNPATLKHYAEGEAERSRNARHFITKGLDVYETLLRASGKAGSYSLGEQLTMADLCLIPQVYNALRYNVDMGPLPLCKRIYDACLRLPSCERAAPQNQPGAT
jgi:maleylacetoacetate isomerase